MYLPYNIGLHKYNQEIYDRIMILFDMLPIAAVVNNKFFCSHGGLSPELMKVKTLQFRLMILTEWKELGKYQKLG